jgi:hypothetical protein
MATRVTDRNTTRKTTKARRLFQKQIVLDITGTSKAKIQKVAAAIHSINVDEVIGGKEEREVQVTHTSTEPKQIYYGRI